MGQESQRETRPRTEEEIRLAGDYEHYVVTPTERSGMTEAEMREIVRNYESPYSVSRPIVEVYHHAKGFLAGLSAGRKEAEGLVKKIENFLIKADDIEYDTEKEFREILKAYKGTVKGEGNVKQ